MYCIVPYDSLYLKYQPQKQLMTMNFKKYLLVFVLACVGSMLTESLMSKSMNLIPSAGYEEVLEPVPIDSKENFVSANECNRIIYQKQSNQPI